MKRPRLDDEDDLELDELERAFVDDLDTELDEETAAVVRGLLDGTIEVRQWPR